MPNLIDLRGSGPVSVPDDLFSCFGWVMDAFWHVHGLPLPKEPKLYFREYAATTHAMSDIQNAACAARAERHQQNMEFQRLPEAESVRQRNVRIEAELQPEPIPGHECVSDCRRFGCEDVAGRPDPDMLYDAWRDAGF